MADPLAAWDGGDPTFDGWVPPVGAHVEAIRVSDGLILTGTVTENRCGLFLDGPTGRHVLTAALWGVRPITPKEPA